MKVIIAFLNFEKNLSPFIHIYLKKTRKNSERIIVIYEVLDPVKNKPNFVIKNKTTRNILFLVFFSLKNKYIIYKLNNVNTYP